MGPFQIYFEVLNLRQEKKIEILWTITIITNCNKVAIIVITNCNKVAITIITNCNKVAIKSLKNTIKSAIIKEKRKKKHKNK